MTESNQTPACLSSETSGNQVTDTMPQANTRLEPGRSAFVSEDYEAYDKKMEAYRQRHRALMAHNKKVLFEALKETGIKTVEVSFDGSGDEGQIEDITATGTNDETVPLPNLPINIESAQQDYESPLRSMSDVRIVIENMSYDHLNEISYGWEDGDGAYGRFIFDVAEAAIGLDFNIRYTSSEKHTYEF